MVFNIDMSRAVRLVMVTVLGVAAVAGCSSSKNPGAVRVNVVAGENFWGNIAAQIGGEHVQVTSIISDPNTDPHEYESSTRNAAQVAHADLVIENGLGYDDFLDKLLSVSASNRGKVLQVDQVMAVQGDNPNPHLWYDIAKLPAVAEAIAAALAKVDPTDAATFTANAKKFSSSLQPITDVISTIRAKYVGTEVAYTERVPGYLIEAAGLTLGVPASFAQSVEDGNDPSAADTARFDSALRDHQVKVLLYNSQVIDATTDKIKTLATSSGVAVVGVSETLPKTDPDFQAWQLRQARELLAALGG
jgi:zinc/manganese transport system substrate-binding protein